MSFIEQGSIKAYTFELLHGQGIVQGIFTRHGGVSPEPWRSLNHGGTVGDERANVVENRRRVFESVGLKVETIFDVWQVHSADVICAREPRPLDELHQKADAIITNRPEITLFMRFADCVPIFLFDPSKKVVGIVHAGWQGTVKKIPGAAVNAMVTEYGCNPRDILAGIGPSICPDHYAVGENVIEAARRSFPGHTERILYNLNGSVHFDLWTANQLALSEAGVEQIQTARICTACHMEDWYSHRGEHGKTGRFGALLALEG
jgi:YfiH family protein